MCSFAPHPPLASGVSSLTYSYASYVLKLSCLAVLVILLLELFELFTAWAKVNDFHMPFLQKELHNNGFSYK